jgi:hypothetical protein
MWKGRIKEKDSAGLMRKTTVGKSGVEGQWPERSGRDRLIPEAQAESYHNSPRGLFLDLLQYFFQSHRAGIHNLIIR